MDRRTVRTHNAIRNAYRNLLEKKKTTHISISEIAREANIDRKTFYLHYSSTDDLVNEFIEERVQALADLWEEKGLLPDPLNVKAVLEVVDEVQGQDMELLQLLSGSSAYDELWARFSGILTQKAMEVYLPLSTLPEEEFRISLEFFVAGLMTTYRRWLQGKYSISFEELVELINQGFQFGLSRYLLRQPS